jgi:phosphoribosylformylglycinamidine synthase
VRLKYPGLAPWEIWLSEAQERMVLAIPPENVSKLQDLCDTFDTELTDIGVFTGDGHIIVRFGEKVVLDLQNDFLHGGIPQRQLKAVINRRTTSIDKPAYVFQMDLEISDTLYRLLSHPNIASKASTIRLYDHEIQGGSVVKPLTGALADGPSDAAVIKPAGTKGARGIVLSNGINVEYGKRDAYLMAWSVIDEAIRNAVAVGADPRKIAILDNFCWGDPLSPETLGSLVEAARGCHDAAIHFGTPFISGKDSLNNEYIGADGLRHAIPPTLLISALGIIEDVNQSITMDLKESGNFIFLVGDFHPVFGGSHYCLIYNQLTELKGEPLPAIGESTLEYYDALHQAIIAGLVRSAHDLSEGGLAVCAAEMCIAGRLGLEITMESEYPVRSLFAETNGCLLVEVEPGKVSEFEKLFRGHSIQRLGMVTDKQVLSVINNHRGILTHSLNDLIVAWNTLP